MSAVAAPLSARMTQGDFESEVTQVRVNADARENTRRIDEEQKLEARRVRRETERAESDRHNSEISGRWGAIMEKSIPEELLKEIDTQRSHCEEVIESKNRVIKEYRQEIKNKEDEYHKLLLKQGEEVDLFVEKMKKQCGEALKHHEAQIANVEQALNGERHAFLNSHQSEFNSLMEKRQVMELRFMEWKQEAIEDDMRQIDQLMVMDAEEYNILKIKLETEIQTLEQQMQEMRATYQLNNEKLEYNFRLLHEREYDHAQQIQQQKKKINRLQDMLSTVRAKYTKSDKKYRQRNVELTEEYKRMTEQYKDLQTKQSHFQEYDSQKYNEVWNLSLERMQESVQQVLKADKVIHEQLLYLLWYPPQSDIFSPPNAGAKRGSSARTPSAKLRSHTSESMRSVAATPQASSRSQTAQSARSASTHKPAQEAPHQLDEVLALIRQEASFLTKSGVKPDSVADLDKAVLHSLGVTNEEDATKLVEYFVDETSTNGLLSSSHVMDALTAFLKDREEAKEKRDAGKEEEVNGKRNEKKSVAEKEKEKQKDKDKEKEGMSEDAVKEYWDRMAGVVPNEVVSEVWERLEGEMIKYNKSLKDRVGLLQGNEALRNQNEELKGLLNQYLSAKINEELIVPPVTIPPHQRRPMQQGGSRASSRQ